MLMVDCDGVIWYDGELVQWCDVIMYVLIYILYYGMGVFEGVCVYDILQGMVIFCLQVYIDWLFDFVYIMNMQILYSCDEINEVICVVVCENNLESVYICLMVFYGSEGMGLCVSGLKVYVIIVVWSWGVYMGEEVLQ